MKKLARWKGLRRHRAKHDERHVISGVIDGPNLLPLPPQPRDGSSSSASQNSVGSLGNQIQRVGKLVGFTYPHRPSEKANLLHEGDELIIP